MKLKRSLSICLFFVCLVLFPACNEEPDKPVPPVPTPEPVYATGLIKAVNRDMGVMHFIPKRFLAPIPDTYNENDQVVKTPIRDQASCGSCWAFASTQNFELAEKLFAGKDINFSEQDLVGRLFYGCDGGFGAGDYQVSHGQLLEEQCPYTATNKRCDASFKPANKGSSWGYVGKPNRSPTDTEIQTAIMTYGSVWVTVGADNAFMRYKSGIPQSCPKVGTNHMVALVGWKTVNGVTYYRLKNSWGESWGEKGYGWFKLGCWNMGEEAGYLAIDAVPCKPPAIKLPAQYFIVAGDEVVLAVKNLSGVTYQWFLGDKKLGDGNELVITPDSDAVYRVVAKTPCGEAEIQTMVTLKK